MARGYVRRAMDVVDTTPPRPLKTVSQKLGRLLGISKQVDPLDSFLLLEPLHDHVQPLPPLPEPLAIKTNASPSLPIPEPRSVRVVGRGSAGSSLPVLDTDDINPRPLISRPHSRDSQASSSTSSSTSSETIRYDERDGAGHAYITTLEEPQSSSSYEADTFSPSFSAQSNRHACVFDDVSPTSTVSDYLPTPTDSFFPNVRRPPLVIAMAEPDSDGVIYRIQPPLPSPTFWKTPSLINLKKRDDSPDFFERVPVQNDSPIDLPPRAFSSLQIRNAPPEIPFEGYLPMGVENSSEHQRRHKSWNGEWNEEVQSVIDKLRML